MLTNKKDLLPDLFGSTPCRVLRRIRINLICTRLVSLVIFYQCFKEKSIDKINKNPLCVEKVFVYKMEVKHAKDKMLQEV